MPAEKDDTREWSEVAVPPTIAIDVLPVRLGRYFIESLIAQGGFAKDGHWRSFAACA